MSKCLQILLLAILLNAASDEFGVWSEVSIEEICKCSVAVTFPRWLKEFDRKIEDHGELRVKFFATERKEVEIQ